MTVYAGKGTIFQITITSTLTTVTQVRSLTWNPGTVETMETDDLSSTYVTLGVTGRAGGGTVSLTLLYDPAVTTHIEIHKLWNTPATNAMSITWPDGVKTAPFTGIITGLNATVERADPVTADISIAVAARPTLNAS